MYESKGEEYFKAIVSDETCFRKSKDKKTNIVPNENTKYNCSVLLQTQSVYYSLKDNDDITYYPQVLLEKCGYRPDVEFTDTEPDSQFNDSDEPEEKINENTVFDE